MWSSHYGLITNIKPLSIKNLSQTLNGSSERQQQFHSVYSVIAPLTVNKIKRETKQYTKPKDTKI
jgi:hypothetical protein